MTKTTQSVSNYIQEKAIYLETENIEGQENDQNAEKRFSFAPT